MPISSVILIDLLLTLCHYLVCYELHLPLLLSFVSTVTWVFGAWWVSLLHLSDFSFIIPPVAMILFVVAKSMRSLCATVASSVSLLSASLLSDHPSSILLPSVLCSLLDSSSIVESWLLVVSVFLWKLPFVQLALALALFLFALALGQSHWRRYALLLSLLVSIGLQSSAAPSFSVFNSFSFAHLTQLLSLLLCVESRCCSAKEMIILATVLITWNGSALSGMFHNYSLWAAAFSVFSRVSSSLHGGSALHVVMLLAIAVLDAMEALHDARIARSAIRWGLLWSLPRSARSEIRRVREFVESRSLQESLLSFAKPELPWGSASEKEFFRQLWGSENEALVLGNLPFSHVLLSPFDEFFAPCATSGSGLYCALKNRWVEEESFGLRLGVLPFVILEYASSDSSFLIYAISHFVVC